ncbi:MAG: CZB domain-containing protein [Gammaproteobacteria bacterium]|nr:CZB domain-containing protein [Gammaproteobacteria bacterium]MDH5650831.1 CZB domain-containing protein [Gammaproteobacteria bacterium]
MSTKDAINKGIAAHGMWKQRLLDAIKTGRSEWTPTIVCQDNQCEFGKWLYNCSNDEKASPHYEKIRNLHAHFHQNAASVLELALKGNKTAAEAGIDDHSEYSTTSASLTREMMNWKASLD